MDTVLACLAYLDDVVVFGRSFDEHLTRPESVLEAIRTSGLILKPEKCRFAHKELKFLANVVNAEGVLPDLAKTTAITNFSRPKDKRGVQRFPGLCAYYRHSVENFAKIDEPLTSLTKDSVQFFWEEKQQDAFCELQNRLQRQPVLAHVDEYAETEMHTDASDVGLGSALVQKHDDYEKVIAHASRNLSKEERNYSAFAKQCRVIIWAMSNFRPYVYGKSFQVVTDHHALCWLAI